MQTPAKVQFLGLNDFNESMWNVLVRSNKKVYLLKKWLLDLNKKFEFENNYYIYQFLSGKSFTIFFLNMRWFSTVEHKKDIYKIKNIY